MGLESELEEFAEKAIEKGLVKAVEKMIDKGLIADIVQISLNVIVEELHKMGKI